jgi:hypothetical protein
MKKIAIPIFALVFSFEVFAIESMDKSTGIFQQQQFLNGNPIVNEQKARMVSWSQPSASFDTADQVSSERHEELFTEIFIYTLIILIYSVYWHKNNKPAD